MRLVFWLLGALGALVLLAAAAAGGSYAYLRGSLPKVEGTVRLAGLKSEITVLRDAWGIRT